MRKEIKKRLEKALITLKEPGGSTIRSIIKVINKDMPILSLRKVLEALQEGINEGFLCMYNGRFKLKEHVSQNNNFGGYSYWDENEEKDTDDMPKSSESELQDEESDYEREEDPNCEERDDVTSKKSRLHVDEMKRRKRKKKNEKSKGNRKGATNATKKRVKSNTKKMRGYGKGSSKRSNQDDIGCDAILEIPSSGKHSKASSEKTDLRKTRGPRCTSMKKDVRMPSKVRIPFVLPSVPQRSGTFNELLRRSPEPVNGPLFDGHDDLSLSLFNRTLS